jgi:hypothetical protein
LLPGGGASRSANPAETGWRWDLGAIFGPFRAGIGVALHQSMLCEAPNQPVAGADALWQCVVSDYRRASLLQRQRRLAESRLVLEQNLAASILDWSESTAEEGAVKVRRLDQMFRSERARLEDAWLANETNHRLAESLLPSLAEQIASEVRRAVAAHHVPPAPAAVPVGAALPMSSVPAPRPVSSPVRALASDIPSIIDALFAQELAASAAA